MDLILWTLGTLTNQLQPINISALVSEEVGVEGERERDTHKKQKFH